MLRYSFFEYWFTNLDEQILDGVANDNSAGASNDVTGTLQSAIEV
jgi:hypothetical protein